MLLSEAMEKFDLARRTEVEESTLTLYTYTFNKLLAYLGDVPIEEIRVDDLRKWRAKVAAAPSRRPPQLGGGEGTAAVVGLHAASRCPSDPNLLQMVC